MATFVLVHGSFHGAWCWERVTPLVERRGDRATAVDLPGRGGTPAAPSLEGYAAHVCEVIAAQPGPVTLVAHSMGGVVATTVAERIPERLERLVYVCAFLPPNGQSLIDLAKTDVESRLMPNLIIDEANGVHSVKPEGVRDSFYHDCSEEDAARAAARLGAESLAVVGTPVAITAARFGRVPRDYILCTDDHALGPSLQRRMSEGARVRELPSSHSPFYSMPERLVELL
jgi:pimeloyl-ACP methyl ester carboxylesterase